MSKNIFKNIFLSTDVLCVTSYSKYILAGIGNNLYVYHHEELILKIKIFIGERIHNIYINEGIIIVKGGKELSIITLKDGCEDYDILCHINCKDWIQDVFCDVKKKIIGLATAHNVIEVWDIQSRVCLQSYVCEEKCILYSCKFVGTSFEDFILLCGTVFSEIVVWAPFLPPAKDQPVLQRLKGHDIICSTSDDRSLRIWRVDAEGSVLERKTWKEAKISLTHTLYGHTARVWKSLILSDWIVSAGEDSKLCVWNKNGGLENCLDLHQESGIRGLSRLEGTECILTGGEDGGITLITPQRLQSHALSCARKGDYSLNENNFGLPRKVAFLRDSVVCTTDRGCVLFAEGQSLDSVIYEDKEFSNYCLLEVSKCKRFLMLGSIKGRIVVIEAETKIVRFNKKLIDGKIFSTHWLPHHLVICSANGKLLTFKTDFDPDLNFDKENVFLLPNSKERWTTCVLIHKNYLIVGDRMGSIHVYSATSTTESPQHSFLKVHGHLGVTDIVQNGDFILTCGRDGKMKQFHVTDRGVAYSSMYKLPMDWPWRLVESTDDRLVLGFTSIYFVIWSLKKRELLVKLDCGGGHRSCDFAVTKNSCKLLYVKDKGVHFSEFSLFRSVHIRTGFHGKEINCLKILQEKPLVFASGSEDTTLRISALKDNSIDQLYLIENHISSVRDLHVLAVSESDRFLFSAGGRGQLSVHKYNVRCMKYEEVEIYFLHKSVVKKSEPEVAGETRIMCVDSVVHGDVILVLAACSDRHIRIFSYRNGLNLLTSIPYSHCILKVEFIPLNSSLILISMGTDGCAVFWEITDVLSNPDSFSKIDSLRIHQSGINSFVVKGLENGKFLLATGGDDNLLSVLLFHLDMRQGVTILHKWRNSNAHSGQITGIRLLKNALLTTSIDQRLSVWRCSAEGSAVDVIFINQYVSPVADIQGVEAFNATDTKVVACLHGKGIEIIEIDSAAVHESLRCGECFHVSERPRMMSGLPLVKVYVTRNTKRKRRRSQFYIGSCVRGYHFYGFRLGKYVDFGVKRQ